MFISNFFLSLCATAIIFLNSAYAVELDIAGIKVGILERRTHTYRTLTCSDTFGSGYYRCVHQVDEEAFFLKRDSYESDDEFCAHAIVCNTNGKLTRLRFNQYTPNGTPCGTGDDDTSACFQRKCLPARNPETVTPCVVAEASE